jgi:glycerol-3-phosphate responsive antiterminator
MWIILDDEAENYLNKASQATPLTGSTVKQMASLIIKIEKDGQSYTILKDRYTGHQEDQTPIEYLPNELKDRMETLLRWAEDQREEDV